MSSVSNTIINIYFLYVIKIMYFCIPYNGNLRNCLSKSEFFVVLSKD